MEATLTRPLLSVCIPTYNRLPYLQENLSSLLPQAEALGVEVCVSDNASTNGTRGHLRHSASSFSCLRVQRQERTLTLGENMAEAILMGRGKYIYPMGDDEYVPDGCIARVLDLLGSDPHVLLLDGWVTKDDLTPIRRHLPKSLRGSTLSTARESFALLWDKMRPGSFLARKDAFRREWLERYRNTSHAYTGSVWEYLAQVHASRGRAVVECSDVPTVCLRQGKKSWKGDAARILLWEVPEWFKRLPDEYGETRERILEGYLRRYTRARSLLALRAKGVLDRDAVKSDMAAFSQTERRKAQLVSMMPPWIASLLMMPFYGASFIRAVLKSLLLRGKVESRFWPRS